MQIQNPRKVCPALGFVFQWLALISLGLLAQPTLAQDHVDTLIVGGQVFRTDSGTFEPNNGLAIQDGKFSLIDFEKELPTAKQVVDLLDGQFILPGIVDCHAHYNVKLIKNRREEFEVMPIIYLANGATVTFSCGEYAPEEMYRLRRRIESGEQVGPRLLTSGPYFGRARPGWRGKTEQEVFDEVDFWAEKGAAGFKAKGIGPKELRFLIERAHHHGLTVTGHLDSGFRGSVNPRDAIEMGIDRVEHFLGGDAMPESKSAYSSLGEITSDMPEYKKVVDLYLKTDTVFDATLTAYGYFGTPREEYECWIDESKFFTPYIQDFAKNRSPIKPMPVFDKIYLSKQQTIADFHKAGGTITLGTDHVSNGTHLPGFGVHRELDAFVRSGISESDAIKIATINGARAMGIDNEHGSIEAGKSADLFVVTGNPLKNIRATRNVKMVMTRGRLYDAAELLESVKGTLGPADESEASDW